MFINYTQTSRRKAYDYDYDGYEAAILTSDNF